VASLGHRLRPHPKDCRGVAVIGTTLMSQLGNLMFATAATGRCFRRVLDQRFLFISTESMGTAVIDRSFQLTLQFSHSRRNRYLRMITGVGLELFSE
jgi:hypothetical protein